MCCVNLLWPSVISATELMGGWMDGTMDIRRKGG